MFVEYLANAKCSVNMDHHYLLPEKI